MRKCFFFIAFCFLLQASGFSQAINVAINSGNPRFPFPQFLDYKAGQTLGRTNAVGVTDIEMEKTIREAYQIMMNRAVYQGTVVNGTKYIEYNAPGRGFTGPQPDVSEGDGYALLAAAYMADKPTFDGLYMYVHDNKGSVVEPFSQCGQIRNPNYKYGVGTIGWKTQTSGSPDGDYDSAADGDYDIAMALLVAYYQWPTDGIIDDCGTKRLYKNLAIDYLKTITDTVFVENGDWTCTQYYCPYGPDPRNDPTGWNGYYSGDIGFDGYFKSGNTWKELTNWNSQAGAGAYTFQGKKFVNRSEVAAGNRTKHIDYIAPSYFKAFAHFLESEDSVKYAWNIHQFKRAEASSDWLMGALYADGLYPTAGSVTMSGNDPTFTDDNFAEDARNPWRTILNYVWHGTPNKTWNPVTHEVDIASGNTFERDNAVRLAERIDFKTECAKLGNDPTALKFKGVALTTDEISIHGDISPGIGKHINYNLGSAAAAVVANYNEKQDTESFDLLADWYKQLVLEWDATDEGEPYPESRYIKSLPKYFHGWFRVLGLLVTTGNYQSPVFMAQPIQANVKVYNAVDKTLAFGPVIINGVQRTPGDLLTYTISYRNFSSISASNVQISFPLPPEIEFVSASNGGTASGGNVIWNIGSIPGYTSTGETGNDWKTFDPTQYPTYGKVSLKVRIKAGSENKIICSQATITAANSTPFTSNEYPNNDTPTMERNCVNIAARSLTIVKRVDRTVMNNGDVANFDIEFENSSKTGWINGGRPGIRVTYANGFPGPNTIVNYFRLLHGADEPYIDPGNYRVSYFVNDAARIGIFNAATNPNGWKLTTTILEGGDPDKVSFSSEEYTFGEDSIGKWNQRLIMRFPDTLMATTQHTNMFFAKAGEPNDVLFVHRGIAAPFRMAVQMEAIGNGSGCGSVPMGPLVKDDWSYTEEVDAGMDDKSLYFPVSPGWFNPQSTYDETLKNAIHEVHVDACAPIVTKTYDRILVEEWDGYIWRRILGNGPVPGREIQNVCIYDTLPQGLVWQGFSDNEALGVKATYDPATRVIQWCVPSMLPGANGRISYAAQATTDCSSDKEIISKAWITSSSDSPVDSAVKIIITCNEIPPQPPVGSTMHKTADAASYEIGDNATYTISFRQSDGTISQPDMSSTANWTSYCGEPVMDFSNTKNPGSSPKLVTYDYSHGTNGILEVKVGVELGQPFSLVFRHNGGTPSCGTDPFKGLLLTFVNNSCSQASVSLFQNGTQVGATKTDLSYAAPFDTMTIRVQLENDKLSFWINNFNALPYVFSGITYLQPGYVGFYNTKETGNANPSHKLLSWYTHFDSAFDVDLSDALPSNLAFTAGTLQTLYNQSSTYTTAPNYDPVSKKISWQLVSGKTPMLFGDSVAFSFSGKINGCPLKYLSNVSYANMLGQPINWIGAQSVTNCGSTTCTPPAMALLSPADTSICEDGTATLQVSTDAKAGAVFTWYKADAVPQKVAEGVDKNSITLTDSGAYYVVISDPVESTCKKQSNTIKVHVNSFVNAGTIGSDQAVCKGTLAGTLLSTTDASGGTLNYAYTWELSSTGTSGWSAIPNSDSADFAPGIITDTLFFRRKVASGVCLAEYSNTVKISVTPTITPSVSIDNPSPVCLGSTAQFTATPANGGTNPYFKWKVNGLIILGENQAIFTSSTLKDKDTITAVLYSSAACPTGSAISNVQIVSMTANPTASVTISEPGKICAGMPVTFKAIPVNGGTSPTYRWFVDGNLVSGAITDSLTRFDLNDGNLVKVEMTSSSTCVSPKVVESPEVAAAIQTKGTPSVDIVASPTSTICEGAEVTFSIAGISNEGSAPGFIWQVNGINKGTDSVFTTSSLKNKEEVSLILSSSETCVTKTKDTSTAIVMLVNKAVTPSLSIAVTSPNGASICKGDTANFSVTATTDGGASPLYTWYVNGNTTGITGAAYSNATLTDKDTVTASLLSTEVCASPATVSSNQLIMSVTDNTTPSLTIAASKATVCKDSILSFTVTSSSNGGSNPVFKWQTDGAYTGDTGASFSTASLADGTVVTAEITSASTCTSSPKAISNPVTVTVLPNVSPALSITATATTICMNDPVTFSIATQENEGSVPAYQWYLNDILVLNETANTFIPGSLNNQDSVYARLTSNAACLIQKTVRSEAVRVTVSDTVDPSVHIATIPLQDTVACEGTMVQLKVTGFAGGGSTPGFQWHLNGVVITAAQSDTYASAAFTDGDKLSVLMTTNASCATSTTALSNIIQLQIKDSLSPQVSIKTSAAVPVCEGTEVTLSVNSLSNEGSAPTYQWIKDGLPITEAMQATFKTKEAGAYSLALSSNAQCVTESTVNSNVLPVNIIPKPGVSISAPSNEFCAYETLDLTAQTTGGITSYSWKRDNTALLNTSDHITIDQGGNYVAIVSTAEGCSDTSAIYPVHLIPVPVVTVSPVSVEICATGTAMLTASENDPSYSYRWLDENNQDLYTTTPNFAVGVAGQYKVEVNYGKCLDTSNLAAVTVKALIQPSIVGKVTPFCTATNQIYTVSNPGGATYSWTVPGDATIVSGQGSASISVNFGSISGKISVVETTSGSCQGPEGSIDIALQKCGFKADFSMSNSQICAGKTITFSNLSTGTGGATAYSWNFGSDAQPSTATGIGPHTVAYNKPGGYSPSLTISDGLVSVEKKINAITVNATPNSPSISGAGTVCLGSPASYTANAGNGSYVWAIEGGSITTASASSMTASFPDTGTALVKVVYTDVNGCSADTASKSVAISNVAPPVLSASSNLFCKGESVGLKLTGANGSITWKKDGQVIPYATGNSFSVNERGTYFAEVTGICTSVTQKLTILQDDFEITSGSDLKTKQGSAIQLATFANQAVLNYIWKPDAQAIANPVVHPSATTLYTVTATGENGCLDTTTVLVTVYTPLFIPNAFTPNGDGIHDEFIIGGLEIYRNVHVSIFNRWGNVVFESTDYNTKPWDGMKNGAILPVATYYYTIDFKNGNKPLSGSVLLSK